MSLKLNTASGGSITLQEADTASNLTLTVPAQAGSVVTADSSGNVGIGTTSNTEKLNINGGFRSERYINKYIGMVTDAQAGYIILARVDAVGNVNPSGFRGRIHIERGSTSSTNRHEYIDVSIKRAYSNVIIDQLDANSGRNIIQLTFSGVNYYAVALPSDSNRYLYIEGYYEDFAPFLAQASQVTLLGITTKFATRNVGAVMAWVSFNGVDTPSIRGSGNVSSISDRGTGRYTVNLISAMPDTNFATLVTGQKTTGDDGYIMGGIGTGGYTTSAIQVTMQIGGVGPDDVQTVSVAIFR